MKLKIISLISIIILLTGCSIDEEDYDQQAIEKAEASVESYLINNYKNIESVEIDKFYKSPMGGMTADGTVNKKYEFNIGVEESDFTIGSMAEHEGFPERKDECKSKTCDY